MYVVIRKFNKMRELDEVARRAEAGVGPLLREAPGFKAYYICDGGHGVGFSVTIFESRAAAATEASAKALIWIQGEPRRSVRRAAGSYVRRRLGLCN